MEHFKLTAKLLAIQSKHFEFFEKSQAAITDYVEIHNGLLNFIKIKKNLPQEIIDDILLEIEK